MNKNDLLIKIKENLKSLMKFSGELKEFSNYDLTDGTKITSPADDLEVGSEVYALDDKGNQTPLNDGDYVLNDGRTITVKGNLIESIAGESPDTEDDQVDESVEAKKVELEEGLPEGHEAEAKDANTNDLAGAVADLQKQVEDILNILSQMGDAQKGVNEQMMSRVEKFASENGGKPIKNRKKEASGYDPKAAASQEFREHLKMYQDLINKK